MLLPSLTPKRTRRNLLDQLVGACLDQGGNGNAEGLGRPCVDDQLEFGRSLDREVGGRASRKHCTLLSAYVIAADLPNADETVVGIMAVIAQREREMIAQRTRDALAVARKRLAQEGRALGNPKTARRRSGALHEAIQPP
jgi:hypothetical protein